MLIRDQHSLFIFCYLLGLLVVSEGYIYIPPENTGTDFEFQLVDANGNPTTNGTGVLMARNREHNAPAGTVCDDGFTHVAATVICREMGYTCAEYWGSGPTSSFFTNKTIVIDNLLCTNSSMPFTNCSYNSDHNCGHNEDISLRCERMCEFEFKLVDYTGTPTTNNTGLLVASKVGTRKNGTVCDDNFGGEAALLICRSMGHKCAASWDRRTDWPIQHQLGIILDDVTCTLTGNQSFSESCTWRTVNNCDHNEDIHLSCGCITDTFEFYTVNEQGVKNNGSDGTGLLVAKKKNSEEAGTVCDDSFTESAANTICKEIGFSCSVFWESAGENRPGNWATVQEAYDIVLDNVECEEDSTGQAQCSYSVEPNCKHSEDIFLFCGSEEDCTQPAFKFYTIDSDGVKTSNGSGLLIAARSFHEDAAGTVCDDNFNSISATLICREMNFNCSLGWFAGANWEIQNQFETKLDNIACGSGNTSFADCSYDTQHNCGHSEDVFLSCANDCNYEFKLLNEDGEETRGSGLLVASRKLTSESGTVCDDNFDDISATVICKEMKYTCSVFWSSGEEWELTNATQNIMLDNVRCVDEDLDFLNCSFSSGGHNCNHREDVHLFCSDSCKEETVSFKLLGSEGNDVTSSGSGLLIASRNIAQAMNVTGTVCDDEFTLITAGVVCKEMGFECAQSFNSGEQWETLQSSFNIVLDNVVCAEGGNTTFSSNCTYNAAHNCGHSEDIFLICDSGEDCTNPRATKFSLVTSTGEESTTGSGLLIATTVQTTGTVCDDRFSDTGATAVCKEMGYECAMSWESAEKWDIQGSYTIALDNVYCESDNFTQCTFDLNHNCGHSEDLFLTCSYKCLTQGGDMRAKLVDTDGTESLTGQGLLIVTSKVDDISDTVCNKGFDMVDAMVFCKSMGYSCALRASSAEQAGTDPWEVQQTYDIMMSDVECEEGTNNLTRCNYNLVHDCDHTHDVYLTCGGVQNIARVGLASQDSTHGDGEAWRAIDGKTLGHYFEDDSTTHTELNDRSGHVWRVTWDMMYSIDKIVLYNRGDCCQERLIGATIWVNGTVRGTVHRTEDLMKFEFQIEVVKTNQVEIRGGTEGTAREALSLAEVEVFRTGGDTITECLPTFYLINEDGNPSTTGSGLLMATNPSHSNEGAGTVCDDTFSEQSANVICKSMGYQCSASWSSGERWGIQADQDIVLDDVSCPSTNSPFSNCTYASNHNCAHTEDVFLSCDNGLQNVGCFADAENPAIPSLEGGNPVTSDHWTSREDPVAVCKQAAESKNWTVFAIQAGGWCSSSADAGSTYNMYGTSTACRDDGTGGPWANQVYNITETGLVDLGCFRDTASRAIPTLEHEGQHPMLDGEPYYREDPIEKCRQAAISSGFTYFAIQNGGYCMSSAQAGTTYKTYGRSDDCGDDGEGGQLANQVYLIRDDACLVVNKEYKFYLVDEKGVKSNKSGLLIAEGTGTGELPGTVCDDMFNDTAAAVICSEMGFSCSTGWTRKFWEEIQKRYPIVLDDVECRSENMSFSDCNFKTTSNCGHNEDIFLGCDNECLPAKYTFELVSFNEESGELVPAPAGKGLLIATKNGTDVRGTVCDDEFTDIAANLICIEMGYVCAKGHFLQRPSSQPQSELDIVLDNIKCDNTSETFHDCAYVTSHNCVHSEDVFLTCKHTLEECEAKEAYTFYLVDRKLNVVTESGSGLLMANRTEEGKTGTVCDDRFNETSANIICNEMNFTCATAFFNAATYKGVQENETIVLDNIECGTDAKRFTDCSYQFHHDCTHNEDVFLVCQNECRGKPFIFNLVDEQGHQTTGREGLLLVHTLKSIEGATSGTVCGDNFNNASAAVICKQMGHQYAVDWSTRDHKGIQMMYPSIMNNVTCKDPDSTFDTCEYVFDNDCTLDVYLICEVEELVVTMCPEGSHYEDDACQPCARNTYKALYNEDPCVQCPEGSVSSEGSSRCFPCPETGDTSQGYLQCTCLAGTVFNINNGLCQVCPPKTYTADILATDCTPCPPGSTSMPGAATCTCPGGSVWSEGACRQCDAGSYSSARSGTCEVCPNVPVLEDGTGCKCPAGYYWNGAGRSCTQCPANSYSSAGALMCVNCPKYFVSDAGATDCSLCKEGKVWDNFKCVDCPKGTYSKDRIECVKGDSKVSEKDSKAITAGSATRSWLWPVLVAVLLAIACVCLIIAVLHLRNKIKRNTVSYGADVLEEAEFMEMSYEPRVTNLGSADNIQLLPANE